MRHGSLFSGIGGFDLAAQWMGWGNVFQVEWDKYCQRVLTKNFPNVKRYGDIKEFDGTKYRGLVDILTGGFSCQPFSVAGQQKGKGDDRHLWPEMLRVIREVRASWIVGENVPGIISMELENICLALESEGYEVQPLIIPSASIGAWDKRERVWIIAYSNIWSNQKYQLQTRGEVYQSQTKLSTNNNSERLSKPGQKSREQKVHAELGTKYGNCLTTDIISSRREDGLYGGESERKTGERIHNFKESDWWKRDWIKVASELCGGNARVSNRMDRIKALGNSVNPYVPYQIFKAIEQYSHK